MAQLHELPHNSRGEKKPWKPFPLNETRLPFEMASLFTDSVFYGVGVPRGDGKPVLVLPGYEMNNATVAVLTNWLQRMGHNAFNWDRFISRPNKVSEQDTEALAAFIASFREPTAIIGHSGGGTIAHDALINLSERKKKATTHIDRQFHPNRFQVLVRNQAETHLPVDQLFTLGTPLFHEDDVLPDSLYEATTPLLHGAIRFRHQSSPDAQPTRGRSLPPEAGVELWRIFSEDDSVVNPYYAQSGKAHNKRVRGSHNGLVYNPKVYKMLGPALGKRGRH